MEMVYSNSLGEMVAKGFTVQKVYIDRVTGVMTFDKKIRRYEWNDVDCVYYNDEIDGDYFMEVPTNGRRGYSLKLGKRARLLVRMA